VDLRLYFRVLGRFRYLVLGGLALALILTFISFFRIGSNGISYRQSETWQSTETLFLTQKGFPWGRTVYPYTVTTKDGQPSYTTPFADPGRFSSLAVLYSRLANSDPVRRVALRSGGPIRGTYLASPVVDTQASNGRSALPFISISGYAISPEGSIAIAKRMSAAFQRYLKQNQTAAGIPDAGRVVVETASAARTATLAQGRRLTIPIVIFLTVLIATVGLAFILENLMPSISPVVRRDEQAEPTAAARGSRKTTA
jgi:hypothetical protein